MSAGAGHLTAAFDPSTDSLSVSSPRNEVALIVASLVVVSKIDGGTGERVLTVSGPSNVQASVGARTQVTSCKGGSYTVAISEEGANTAPSLYSEPSTFRPMPPSR